MFRTMVAVFICLWATFWFLFQLHRLFPLPRYTFGQPYNTKKMISSGGASLRSWHQLYSRVFICVKYLDFEPLTGQAKHNQIGAARLSIWPWHNSWHPWVRGIKAFSRAGERYSHWSTCSYSTTENSANREWLRPLPWLQLEMNK